jgi:hypothetical protein
MFAQIGRPARIRRTVWRLADGGLEEWGQEEWGQPGYDRSSGHAGRSRDAYPRGIGWPWCCPGLTDPCCGGVPSAHHDFTIDRMWSHSKEESQMNQLIYIVGLVVVIVVILGFFGLR